MSQLQVARVTDHKAGSSVCEASSSVFFSEEVQCSRGSERGLFWLLTRRSLTC